MDAIHEVCATRWPSFIIVPIYGENWPTRGSAELSEVSTLNPDLHVGGVIVTGHFRSTAGFRNAEPYAMAAL